MDDIYVARHIAHTLETAAELFSAAGIVPAPKRVHIIIEADTAGDAAAWARALLKCGTQTADDGQVFAERGLDCFTILRIQADGDGVL